MTILRQFCKMTNKEIGIKPLGACLQCSNLLYVRCPEFEAKKANPSDEMRLFFSSHKEGEVHSSKPK